MRQIFLGLFLSAGITGCAGSQVLTQTFPDTSERDLQTVIESVMHAGAPRSDRAVGVGVTAAEPSELFAWDVANGQRLWSTPATLLSTPVIAGNYVIGHEDQTIIGRNVDNGNRVFEVPAEALQLVGGDGEGSRAVFVLSTGGGVGATSRIVFVEEGAVKWTRTVEHALGIPALRGEYIVLPWANQNISVMRSSNASEVARMHLRDDVVGRAFVDGDSIYLGQTGLFRLTPSLAAGTKTTAAFFTTSTAELPGHPAFSLDAYGAPPPPHSGLHSVRTAWRPAGEGEHVTLLNDSLYLIFFKLVFALDAQSGSVKWVHSLPNDIVGAAVESSGIVVTDDAGKMTLLHADDGRAAPIADLGSRPTVMVFRAPNWAPTTASTEEVQPLAHQLMAAAQNNDSRIVPARAFAVKKLSEDQDPAVTENLLVLCETIAWPLPVHQASCGALGERRVGGDFVVRALERHGAFLQGRHEPPVGALAQAAAQMHERRAVPLLIAHLRDPQTPVEDLPAVVTALKVLADHSAGAPLEDFLRLYHADNTQAPLVSAVKIAAEAVGELVGPVSADMLQAIADDPLAIADVREAAQNALVHFSEQSQAAAHADAEGQQAQARAATEAIQTTSTLPVTLTAAHAETALAPVTAELRECLRTDASHPASIRIVIAVSGEGQVQQVTTTPPSAQACVAPIVTARAFPANRNSTRQTVTYTVRH